MTGRAPRARLLSLAILSLAGAASACTGGSDSAKNSGSCDVVISRFKELEIVDESVVGDARASNTSDGAWSFRHLVENMSPTREDASKFVLTWLSTFGVANSVNGYSVPSRPDAMAKVTCPWLQRTPENECSSACDTCNARALDLAKAPFRLIGISNRIDQRLGDPPGSAGEGRFVFALTNGPGDDPASQPLEMTVILEYGLPTSTDMDAKGWAAQWHDLGQIRNFDESFRARLQEVTDRFTARGAWPSRQNGSALDQARINDHVTDWDWSMREFKLTSGGYLATAPTKNTPDISMNGAAALTNFVNANIGAIRADTHTVPNEFLGGQAIGDTRWTVPGVSEDERKAFAKGTCNGCHRTEAMGIDVNFHISPLRSGVARLSTFLNDPSNTDGDDLHRREEDMKLLLCPSQ